MMTATTRKTLLENKHLCNCNYFAIIPSCSHFTMLAKNATTGLVCAPLNFIQRIKDSELYAQIVIKTVNVVISRCCFVEDGTDLLITASRTCITLIFPRSTNQTFNFMALSLPFPSLMLKLPTVRPKYAAGQMHVSALARISSFFSCNLTVAMSVRSTFQ